MSEKVFAVKYDCFEPFTARDKYSIYESKEQAEEVAKRDGARVVELVEATDLVPESELEELKKAVKWLSQWAFAMKRICENELNPPKGWIPGSETDKTHAQTLLKVLEGE